MNINELYAIFRNFPEVCTDTRKIVPNCLFFALKGPQFNGNLFAAKALELGAAYAITDEITSATDKRMLYVEDVLKTLQKLALLHRKTMGTTVIALTGSNGKTTTKELMSVVLSAKYHTLSTQGNLNNHIGVPLTLLRLNSTHQKAVVEMGANHQGEIDALCNIAFPDAGLITNTGKAHLEGFGGEEGVVKGKTELFRHLIANNKLILLNTANPKLILYHNYARVFRYGLSGSNNFTGRVTGTEPFLTMEIEIEGLGFTVATQLVGAYNAENVLAAAATGHLYGVPAYEIKNAIESYNPSNNRSQLILRNGLSIIMDAYNANPSSMKAAIENFSARHESGKYFILGDMFELGDSAREEHEQIIKLLKEKKLTQGILVGNTFSGCSSSIPTFTDTTSAISHLQTQRDWEKCTILVKGSRGMGLEKVLSVLNPE